MTKDSGKWHDPFVFERQWGHCYIAYSVILQELNSFSPILPWSKRNVHCSRVEHAPVSWRQSVTFRCSVRSCPSGNRPGYSRWRACSSVMAFFAGSASNSRQMRGQTSENGSRRVRYVLFTLCRDFGMVFRWAAKKLLSGFLISSRQETIWPRFLVCYTDFQPNIIPQKRDNGQQDTITVKSLKIH